MAEPKSKINTKALTKAIELSKLVKDIDTNNASISISKGNKKLGAVANISLPPVVTCSNCNECKNYCYAIRSYTCYPTVWKAWNNNLAIFKNDPEKYFNDISKACYVYRFFRWHTSGDIIDLSYFIGMCKVASENLHCQYLAFTKNYKVVNEYIKSYGEIPNNLHIVFSAAPNTKMENPYSLPECHINFENKELNTFKGCKGTVYHCSGNCEECIANGCGCFNLSKNDVTIINQH